MPAGELVDAACVPCKVLFRWEKALVPLAAAVCPQCGQRLRQPSRTARRLALDGRSPWRVQESVPGHQLSLFEEF